MSQPANDFVYRIEFNYHYYNQVFMESQGAGIFVMIQEKGMALIERLPGVEDVIVAADGTVSVSSGLQGRLQLSP